MIENNELWDAYCAEVPAKYRSPQGAMAFAFDKLSGVPAQRAPDWKLILNAIKVRLQISSDQDVRRWTEIERIVRTVIACALISTTPWHQEPSDDEKIDYAEDVLSAVTSTPSQAIEKIKGGAS